VGRQFTIEVVIEPSNGLLTGIPIELSHPTPRQDEKP
jgi:hypothetical protein